MSAMHPFVLRLPDETLARCRVQARSEGAPLPAWLRHALRWYLTTWLPAHRHAAGGEAIDDETHLATIAPNRRVGLPKRLLERAGLRPGDRVILAVRGNKLVARRHVGTEQEVRR